MAAVIFGQTYCADCFAGAVCRQILESKGVKIAAHISSIGNVSDSFFCPTEIDDALIEKLNSSSFALIDETAENL